MTPAIRVLIVDDHAILRKGIRALLSTEADMEVVGRPPTGWRRWPGPGNCGRTWS